VTSNNRLWILVAGMLAVAVIALGWFLGISPKLAEASTASDQREGIEATNEQYRQETDQLKSDFENLAPLKAELAEMVGQLPANANYSAFLDEVDALASAESVDVANVSFGAPAVLPVEGAAAAETVPAPADGEATNAVPSGSVITIPTTLTITGSFGDLRAMIGKLQTGDRLFLISGLDFSETGATDVAADASSGGYSVGVTGLLYVLTDGTTLITSAPEDAVKTDNSADPSDEATGEPTPSPSPTSVETTPTPTLTRTSAPTDGETATPSGSPTPTATSD
jgi:hypothetical protein